MICILINQTKGGLRAAFFIVHRVRDIDPSLRPRLSLMI